MSADRDFDQQRAAALRMLIYPIQFESEPFNGIDRVVAQVFAEHCRIPLNDVIVAIGAGLASDAKLAELLPQSHSEVVIRRFLSAFRTRLEAETEKG